MGQLKVSSAATVLIFGICLSTVPNADLVKAGPSTVMSQTMSTYTYESGGDVVFELSGNQASGCDGFWLRASDSGFKSNFAVLLTMA